MNILVVRTDKLGDFITALPTLYVLKNHNPSNKIIACVAPLNEELAKSCDFIDSVIVDDTKNSIFSLVQKLHKEKIDASITLFSNTRVALAQFLAFIPKRIAPATKIAQIFYNKKVKQRRSKVEMAEFEYNLELTKALFTNINLHYPQPLLEVETKKLSTKKTIAFHVGFGGSSDANLTLDEYTKLIDVVLQQRRYHVVLTFGPDEKELMQTMQSKLQSKDVEFYLSQGGIVEFAKILKGFELFVSTSTGTYHLASLVGTKTLTFFADSLFASPKRWRGVGDINLQKNIILSQSNKEEILQEITTYLQEF